jgi:nickel-type superoxide dismutase maturation protease
MSNTMDVRIQGDSMWPTFSNDDIVVFTSVKKTALEEGDIVLATHPFKADVLVVKRIHRVETDGRLFLVGDNPDPLASEDSHNFGPVSPDAVRGKWKGE